MGRFFEAMKAGARGFMEGEQPREYSIAGRQVKCPHCGGTKFAPGSALLSTRWRSAFSAEWLDPLATVLACAECGRIEWFANEPDAS
jgi:hypothetical protein